MISMRAAFARLSARQRAPVARRETVPRPYVALVALIGLFLFFPKSILAFPINYTVNGTLASTVTSGPDPFHLAGGQFSLTGSIDTTAALGCTSSCSFFGVNLQLTVSGSQFTISGNPITLTSGNPGSIAITSTISVAGLNVPFSAVIRIPLTKGAPYAFSSEAVQGGSVSYGQGANATTIAITAGSVAAVGNAPPISVNPTSLSFSAVIGGVVPAPQSLSVNAASPVGFTAAAVVSSPSGGSWLSVTPAAGTTNGSLSVSVNPAGLKAGNYTGSITIGSPDAPNTPISVPVSLSLSATPTLSVNPGALMFTYSSGGALPTPQPLLVSASGGAAVAVMATVSTVSGGAWLSVNPNTGTTPVGLSVVVNPNGLTAGAYSGAIAISAVGISGSTVSVTVILTVVAPGSLLVSPASLSFSAATGTNKASTQTVNVTSSGPTLNLTIAAATTSGGSWLSVTPATGITPATLSVTANPTGLANGIYSGSVTVTASGTSGGVQVIAVTLTVGQQATLSAAPATLSFIFAIGSASPPSQSLTLTNTGGAAVNYSVVLSGGIWFSLKPAFGSTPATLEVAVDPAGLAIGVYSAIITITPNGVAGNPIVVPVTLTVTPPAPVISTIADAASFVAYPLINQNQAMAATSAASSVTGLAPGSIFTIFGDNLGPDPSVPLVVMPQGTLATALDNTTVLVNGAAAPLLFVYKNQINALAPYGVDGKSTATIQVQRQGAISSVVEVPVAPAAPALFTADMSGKGQGAILNVDNTANSSNNPAQQGSIVILWGEGAGQTNPAGVDGTITKEADPLTLPAPVLPVSVEIGGQPAQVLYAGAAPGLVAGVLQINVQLPAGLPSGSAPVVVKVGSYSSQAGVTLAVR